MKKKFISTLTTKLKLEMFVTKEPHHDILRTICDISTATFLLVKVLQKHFTGHFLVKKTKSFEDATMNS